MKYYEKDGRLLAIGKELTGYKPITEIEYNRRMDEIRRRAERSDSIREKSSPLSTERVIAMLITQQINTLTVDDNTALRMKSFYPTFDSIVGQTVKKGFKFTYADKLWSVLQENFLIQSHYPPGTGVESLYTEVCETHSGTMDDPIPYSGNMALVNDLYYSQDGAVYHCILGTGQPVYQALTDLVGLYVEVYI